MKIIEELKENNLKEIYKVLKEGGIIIYPTDTVYGIGCDCFNEKAIEKLFSFKERPKTNPINVLTDSYDKIKIVAENITSKEEELIKKYLPGDMTIILKKKKEVPKTLTANLPTIGVRIPKEEKALKILASYPTPLATSSVNLSGESPGIEVSDFLEEFKDKVDLIIDGGKSPIGFPSTIIKVENDTIKVLRQGKLIVE